jgi:hypothetical protein
MDALSMVDLMILGMMDSRSMHLTTNQGKAAYWAAKQTKRVQGLD